MQRGPNAAGLAPQAATLVVMVVFAGLLLTTTTSPEAANIGGDLAEQGRLTSAEECGRCHRDIHRYWKSSMHAQAADNWRFQDALHAVKKTGEYGVEALCARCHAPAAVYTSDTRWERQSTWEGVTCDFCHSVREVRLSAERPFVLDVGAVKTGPLPNVVSPGHGTRYAAMYASAMLCAPCHQFVNSRGFNVLSTYAEWQASEYGKGEVTCQQCHMRAAAGKIVDPKVAKTPGAEVNLHEMPGGHSVVELNRALHALISAERRDDQVVVTMRIANRGAGHALPTGSPLRSIVMEVEVDSGLGQRQRVSRTFARTVVDEQGGELLDEAGVWLRGARESADTRIRPGERRTEHFSFPMPRHAPVRAVARFFYRYGPEPPAAGRPGLPFLSVNTWLDAEPR